MSQRLLTIFAVFSLLAGCSSPGAAPQDEFPSEKTPPGPAESEESVDPDAEPSEAIGATNSGGPISETPVCEALPDDRRIAELTPEYEAFVREVKAVGKKVGEEYGRETWSVFETDLGPKAADLCTKWAGRPLPEPSAGYESKGDCVVEFQLGGSAAVISQTLECSSDGCSTDEFVWSGASEEATRIQHSADFVNVAPGAAFAYYAGQGSGAMDTWIFREFLESGSRCVVTEGCFSPRLSPDGSFHLCRDKQTRVLKVAAAGGTPNVVAESKVPEGHRPYIRSQWADVPQPPEFVDAKTVRYETTYERDPPSERLTDEHTFELTKY